jgi:hypothetical protein
MIRIRENDMKAVVSDGTRGRQLGDGAYLSPAFQEYTVTDPSKGTPWDCAVTMESGDWDGLAKAWIPRLYQFPEDVAKNPDKCNWLPLWTPRYSK